MGAGGLPDRAQLMPRSGAGNRKERGMIMPTEAITLMFVTVTGDLRTASLEADTTTPIADLLPGWAAECSSSAPAELVVLSGDTDATLFDLAANLGDLGVGYGAVLRLVPAAKAIEISTPQVATPTPAAKPQRRPWAGAGRSAAAPPPLPAGVATRPDPRGFPPKVPAGRRVSRAVKAVLTRSQAPGQQVGAFGKNAGPPKAADRYRRAMQATDRVHNLETMTRQATLPHCMVIAVASPKGGAGKTTITALLGMLFAELRRDPVLAIDANPDFGNLQDKLRVGARPTEATDDFYAWLEKTSTPRPAELTARLGIGPHGVRYLPTPRGDLARMVLAADFGLYQDLIARLRHYEGIILVDCGTGLLDPPVRAALETADQIVLVTDSSADTAGLVVTAAQYLPQTTPTWLIANKMPPRGAMVDLDRVAQAIPQLRGVTVVPNQPLAENVVTPQFDWAQAPGGWQQPVREIAARLANDWAAHP